MTVFIETTVRSGSANARAKYKVRAICTSAGEANVVCSLNPDLAVIAEDPERGLIFVAELAEYSRA